MIFQVFFFFVFGLILGSFLNVVVCRMKENETLLGRSFCRSCKQKIRWYDNIPVLSFVFLLGKCRACNEKISWQYPAVELLTGILYAGIGAYIFSFSHQSTWLQTLWLLLFSACFLVIAAYDMRHMEIPLIPLYMSAAFTILFLLTEFRSGESLLASRFGLGLLGGLAVGAFFFALVYVSKETWMGWGDVWLGLSAGMAVGLPAALFMLTVSFLFGAVVGVSAIVFDGKTLKTQIPFAPFLVFGTFVALFFPYLFPNIAHWFFL